MYMCESSQYNCMNIHGLLALYALFSSGQYQPSHNFRIQQGLLLQVVEYMYNVHLQVHVPWKFFHYITTWKLRNSPSKDSKD